jgi:preprotein translocase subunit SecD
MRNRPTFPAIVTSVVVLVLFVLTLLFADPPRLGLDLQGGVSVVLKPHARGDKGAAIPRDSLEQTKQIIDERVNGIGVAESEVTVQGSNIVVQLPGIKDQETALEVVGTTAELTFRPVLQQAGATLSQSQRDDLEKTRDDLRAKLHIPEGVTAQQVYESERVGRGDAPTPTTTVPDGTDESSPTTTGASTTAPSSTVPTGDGTGGSRSVKGRQEPTTTTAVAEEQPSTTLPLTTTTIDPAPKNEWGIQVYKDANGDLTDDFSRLIQAEASLKQADTHLTPRTEDDPSKESTLAGRFSQSSDGTDFGKPIYHLGPALVSGDAVEGATATIQQGEWMVLPSFKAGKNGIDKFNAAAAKCFSRDPVCPLGQLAVVLDAEVLTAPEIRDAQFSRDQVQISGAFSEEEAKQVAVSLKYGALPLVLEQQQVQTVSATLGKGALEAALIAGGVGVLLIAVYLIAYYRVLGAITLVTLLWSSLSTWILICWGGEWWSLTLTLAGIVGMIVSIGMSLDSSIVYYENLKEDVHNGRTLRSAVGRSFDGAFGTIMKANSSSFIGAVILYLLSIGPVKGFAFFLAITTVFDVVFTWSFTRPAVISAATSKLGRKPSRFGIPVDHGPPPTAPEAAATPAGTEVAS